MLANWAVNQVQEVTMNNEQQIITKEELYLSQAPAFNFEYDADELLHQALLSGYVDQVGDDQYQVNVNYPEKRES
jgi:hypothetical protein